MGKDKILNPRYVSERVISRFLLIMHFDSSNNENIQSSIWVFMKIDNDTLDRNTNGQDI